VPLQDLLPANIFAVLLVFARVGTALILLPGLGDLYVPQRVRLLLALFLSLIVVSVLGPALPAAPSSPAALVALLFGEIVVGLLLGSIARILVEALEAGGVIISMQLSLSMATVFNPAAAQQSSITGAFMVVLGTLVIFLTDAHHLMLRALVDSYSLFIPGAMPPFEDFASTIVRYVSLSFRLGVELAAPLIVAGTLFYVALGLIAKLMPQLQVFFIVMPLQIIGGLLIFALTLVAVMHWFAESFAAAIGTFVLS
jgi:flagellar biosynthesis protein FliR